MKYYQRPTEKFFVLPNSIFDLRLEPIQFSIYAYLVSCAGSKGYCWPRQQTICDKTGIGLSSAQKHLKILEQRKLINVHKHPNAFGHPNNQYTLLSLDDPAVYRDPTPPELEELPFCLGEEFSA